MQRKKLNENTLKVIETFLFICLIVTPIKLPEILNNGVTMSSRNWGYDEIYSNFYLPIFMDVLLIISIIIFLWKSILNIFLGKERTTKSLQIIFIILALLTIMVTINSYSTTYRELENYDYLVHHTKEKVKSVTLHKEELKGNSLKYFVIFAEGVKYEVSKYRYDYIKRGFGNGPLNEDVSYAVPYHYSFMVEFLRDDTGIKTKILSVDIHYWDVW